MSQKRSVLPWLRIDYKKPVKDQLEEARKLQGYVVRDAKTLAKATEVKVPIEDVVIPVLFLNPK